ncbi:hypothetical protein E2C01_085052 [Portunus trituberculatus]|uniref:Uncharacterized protein n=1 Tax=Portunus trituberculatus TaxID=210409 RepID=A0A5B7J5N5_PORTR|nr:hypothetical protein [Portunus trituberculatus]
MTLVSMITRSSTFRVNKQHIVNSSGREARPVTTHRSPALMSVFVPRCLTVASRLDLSDSRPKQAQRNKKTTRHVIPQDLRNKKSKKRTLPPLALTQHRRRWSCGEERIWDTHQGVIGLLHKTTKGVSPQQRRERPSQVAPQEAEASDIMGNSLDVSRAEGRDRGMMRGMSGRADTPPSAPDTCTSDQGRNAAGSAACLDRGTHTSSHSS